MAIEIRQNQVLLFWEIKLMNPELERKLWNAGQTNLIYKKETWIRLEERMRQ